MTKNLIDNKKILEYLVDIGIVSGTTKPGTIIASKTAKRAHSESLEVKFNKKINKILR